MSYLPQASDFTARALASASGLKPHLVAESISERSSDNDLLALGKQHIQRLVRVFKATKRPTSLISEHPSRPDLDDVQELRTYILQQASLNHNTATHAAFVRDGFTA
ncbi:hypothetical protein F5146DRAFT_1142935 [Armillaria mellea]|nr:hypothetical protein F5146DRAFT_1142935 [Armillaria mellea]